MAFPKKLLLIKKMVGAILFYFCDSYLITLIFAPRRLQRCHFRHPILRDIQHHLLVSRVAFFTPK